LVFSSSFLISVYVPFTFAMFYVLFYIIIIAVIIIIIIIATPFITTKQMTTYAANYGLQAY